MNPSHTANILGENYTGNTLRPQQDLITHNNYPRDQWYVGDYPWSLGNTNASDIGPIAFNNLQLTGLTEEEGSSNSTPETPNDKPIEPTAPPRPAGGEDDHENPNVSSSASFAPEVARIEAPDLQTSAQVPASQNSTYDPYGEFDKDAIIFDNDGHHIIRNVDELDISQAEKDAINNKLWNRWNWSNWGAGTYYSLAEQYVRAGVKVVRLPRDWSPPPRPSAVAVPTPPVQIPAVPAPPVVLQVIEQAVESQEGVGQFIDGLGQSIGKSGERANSWSHVLGSTAGTLLVGAVVSAGIGAGLTALGIAGAPAVTVAAIVIGVGFLGYHAYQTYSHWDDLNGYERVESVLNPLAGLLGGWLAPRGPIMSLPRFNWQPAPQLSFAGVGSSGSSAGAISIAGSIRIINSATGAQTASAGFLGTYVFSTTGGGNGPKVEGEAPKVEVGKDVSDKSFIGTRISLQKQKRHLPDSVDGERGYMLSVADAQKVVDEFHNGNAKVISFDKLQNEVVVQVTSVTGIHRYKNGTVVKESNVFVIAGKGHSVKVYPTDPALGL